MPADFIPAAEQSCLMRDLTAYVVDAALAQAARWRQDGHPPRARKPGGRRQPTPVRRTAVDG